MAEQSGEQGAWKNRFFFFFLEPIIQSEVSQKDFFSFFKKVRFEIDN